MIQTAIGPALPSLASFEGLGLGGPVVGEFPFRGHFGPGSFGFLMWEGAKFPHDERWGRFPRYPRGWVMGPETDCDFLVNDDSELKAAIACLENENRAIREENAELRQENARLLEQVQAPSCQTQMPGRSRGELERESVEPKHG